ncbi:MAG: Dabb family protein [Streptosporangiaceae bacterium]
MFRHSVLFAWKPEATPEQKKEAASRIASLPSLLPTVRAFAAGPDAGVNADSFDYAVTVDFDDEAGYLSYRDDPQHREIVAKYIAPITAERAAVQYQF